MAYVSQELKAKLSPAIKAVLKKYGVKGSIAVRNHSTLVLNIKSGSIDFINNFNEINGSKSRPAHLPFQPATTSIDVNPYWYHEHFDGKALKFFKELFPVMNNGNHDNSDIQTDYFDVGWYVDVNVGQWNKPYTVTK
jgi:hypothetical protein